MSREDRPAVRQTPVAPAGVNADATTHVGTTEPPEDNRQECIDALHGVRYDGRIISIDPRAAADVVPLPDASLTPMQVREANLLLRQRRVARAIGTYVRAVLNDPAAVDAYYGLSSALLSAGMPHEACGSLRAAVQLDSRRIDAWERLAIASQIAENLPEAIAAWREVIAQEPARPGAHGRLAVALYYAGELDGAAAELELARAFGEAYPEQLFGLIEERRAER